MAVNALELLAVAVPVGIGATAAGGPVGTHLEEVVAVTAAAGAEARPVAGRGRSAAGPELEWFS